MMLRMLVQDGRGPKAQTQYSCPLAFFISSLSLDFQKSPAYVYILELSSKRESPKPRPVDLLEELRGSSSFSLFDDLMQKLITD